MTPSPSDRHVHAHPHHRGLAHGSARAHGHAGPLPRPSVLQRGLGWRLSVVGAALAALGLVLHASLAR